MSRFILSILTQSGFIFSTWKDVPDKMTQLRSMLEKQYPKPAVVFLHCDEGKEKKRRSRGKKE